MCVCVGANTTARHGVSSGERGEDGHTRGVRWTHTRRGEEENRGGAGERGEGKGGERSRIDRRTESKERGKEREGEGIVGDRK